MCVCVRQLTDVSYKWFGKMIQCIYFSRSEQMGHTLDVTSEYEKISAIPNDRWLKLNKIFDLIQNNFQNECSGKQNRRDNDDVEEKRAKNTHRKTCRVIESRSGSIFFVSFYSRHVWMCVCFFFFSSLCVIFFFSLSFYSPCCSMVCSQLFFHSLNVLPM